MQTIENLTTRQLIEGMTLSFNAEAAGELQAAIQFHLSGAEAGDYILNIADGQAAFEVGTAVSPTLSIIAPAEVWRQISLGKLSGEEALMAQQYQATGDLNLLLQLNTLFERTTAEPADYTAPPEQRPTGPLPFSGRLWLTIAFIPWIIHWVTFEIPVVSHGLSVGLPLLFFLLIVGYRQHFNKPTWLEWGSLLFFGVAALLTIFGNPIFARWGSVISTLVMGSLWLSSLVTAPQPLSIDYAKWGYIKTLWPTSLLRHPNAVISLMWGWQFLLAAGLGAAALLWSPFAIVLTVLRYLLLLPAFWFTAFYEKGALSRSIANPERDMAQIRVGAGIGLGVTAVALLIIFI